MEEPVQSSNRFSQQWKRWLRDVGPNKDHATVEAQLASFEAKVERLRTRAAEVRPVLLRCAPPQHAMVEGFQAWVRATYHPKGYPNP